MIIRWHWYDFYVILFKVNLICEFKQTTPHNFASQPLSPSYNSQILLVLDGGLSYFDELMMSWRKIPLVYYLDTLLLSKVIIFDIKERLVNLIDKFYGWRINVNAFKVKIICHSELAWICQLYLWACWIVLFKK